MPSIQRLYLKNEEQVVDNAIIGSNFYGIDEMVKLVRRFVANEIVEHSYVFFLDPHCLCIGYMESSTGGTESTIASLRAVFITALLAGACRIVTAHNHPSGHPRASKQDLKSAKRYSLAASLLGMHHWDSIVVTKDNYFSMREFDLLPSKEETDKIIDKLLKEG